MPAVAVVGASNDREKYGNKAVRAYLKRGWRVFPVNQRESEIEGLDAYGDVAAIGEHLDRVALYVPPEVGLRVVEGLAGLEIDELFLNPGTASPELVARAERLGLSVRRGCAIVDIGESPGSY